jgi:hypothetical protein
LPDKIVSEKEYGSAYEVSPHSLDMDVPAVPPIAGLPRFLQPGVGRPMHLWVESTIFAGYGMIDPFVVAAPPTAID